MKKVLAFLVLVSSMQLHGKVLLMLEGVTGAGKSTFTSMLERKLESIVVIPEPFDRWNNINNQDNLFAEFVKDQSRWGFTFQNYALLTHIQGIKQAYEQFPNKHIYITDRSPYSGIYTFTKMLYDKKLITRLEWNIYQEGGYWLIDQLQAKPDGFIYLRTKPETACYRANKRNRVINDGLHLGFFQGHYGYHEDWFMRKNGLHHTLHNIPILVIDGELDFESDEKVQQKIIAQVLQFVNDLEARKQAHPTN